MALAIPIISTFDGDGVSKAIKEFKQLETTSEKAQFAIKKAAVPAAAALAGLTTALGLAVKGAIEDAAAQDKLAEQIRRTTGATDAQIKANEDWISTQGTLLGVTDDELRPALGNLVRATGDITKAQDLAAAAMDISAAKGISLETATKALEKAYGGNLTALAKISPELRDMIKDGASLDDVMAQMSKTFGGAASDAAETTAGKFKRMKISIDETKEAIGASLMPAVEKVLPYLQGMADWASKNPGVFTIIAGTIGAVALSIMAVNTAMALNPFGLIAVGIGVLITGIAIAYTKFEGFRSLVRNVVNGLSDYFEFMANAWIKVTNIIISGLNLISPFKDIPKMGSVSFGKIGPEDQGAGFTSARQAEASMFGGGGSVSAAAPTIPAFIPQSPSKKTTAPPSGLGGGNGGTDFGLGNISFTDMPLPPMTINIDAGLISSPATVGEDIISAILAAQRNSGTVFAPASGL